ncbi:uncharacterized protein At1g65760-like [Telopea speciosissima]|uniref:uncharacterized protein At1g65760-like n=1 Tax=Telopea speciosissima TaxID=54955 RepID=UPI001CC66F68|nr:uncharacterized protein At1g65760-like [Telopea speciosissima]
MAFLPEDDCDTNRKRLKKSIENCHDDVENNNIALLLLPEDIIILEIVNKLDLVDFHRFSAVCRSWQSIAIAARKIRQFLLRPQLPCLMLSSSESSESEDHHHHHHGFFSVFHGKVFRLELPPEVYGARCCGSNWGWLIMVGNKGCNFLLNPFTRVRIELPPQSTLPSLGGGPFFDWIERSPNYIRKAMLMLSPPPPAAAATTNNNSNYLDDCSNPPLHPKRTSCNIAPPAEDDLKRLTTEMVKSVYLVECRGELLMVIRCAEFVVGLTSPKTVMFKIFKLDPQRRRWIKEEDLGDQMLFIGTSSGTSSGVVIGWAYDAGRFAEMCEFAANVASQSQHPHSTAQRDMRHNPLFLRDSASSDHLLELSHYV